MKKLMYIAIALLVLAGCNNKENAIENAPQEVVTIKGSIVLPKTPKKIAPAEGWQSAETAFNMLWQEGDKIFIYNQGNPETGEVFTLVDGAGTSEGTFQGTALEDMSDYLVSNEGQTGLGNYIVEYVENNFSHPYIHGTGNESGFAINNFGAVLGLPLKGEVTLSKIVVEIDLGGGMITTFTMPFGADGLVLNNTTATMVYIPVDAPGEAEKETISFYVRDEVLMSNILTEAMGNLPECNKVTTFPELEVKDPYNGQGFGDFGDAKDPYNGHEFVDLGLPSGLKWATMNVGATTPESAGSFFAWGETTTKSDYDWGTYKYIQSGQSDWRYINKYQYPDAAKSKNAIWFDSSGNFIGDNKTVLESADDAASVNWGAGWRMPTKEEFDELMDEENCQWKWKTNYNGTNMNGYLVISRKTGYTDKSIFLPAAGYIYGSLRYDADSYGDYWSSSLNTNNSNSGRCLKFSSYDPYVDNCSRCCGLSVRPVCE